MDATPIDIQATWDYWATVESTDLTEIAGGESAVLTEQADDATKAAHVFETAYAQATMTAANENGQLSIEGGSPVATTQPVIAYQLPNTGSGGRFYPSVTVTLFILLAMLCVYMAIRLRREQ
jgi:hypothetical protein